MLLQQMTQAETVRIMVIDRIYMSTLTACHIMASEYPASL